MYLILEALFPPVFLNNVLMILCKAYTLLEQKHKCQLSIDIE